MNGLHPIYPTENNVLINAYKSNLAFVLYGVPQDSDLGPFLF